jgi:HEAT repeat protein
MFDIPPTDVPGGVDRLRDLLGDADPDVRLRAAIELGEARDASAAADLVERYGREWDFQVREALTWATLRISTDAAMPLVRRAVGDPRWLSRLQATHTLSKVGDVADTARLLPVVDDPVGCVAARAWWAVSRCGDPIAIPALVAQLGRGDADQRNSLLVALASFGDEAVPGLVAAVRRGTTAAVRRHAADVLAWLGSPAADPGRIVADVLFGTEVHILDFARSS